MASSSPCTSTVRGPKSFLTVDCLKETEMPDVANQPAPPPPETNPEPPPPPPPPPDGDVVPDVAN